MTRYDEVLYPSVALEQTQPDRMATQRTLLGLDVADPRRARVLEIGCSDAGNLAALAAHAPQAQFLGVDLSAEAVTRAQSTIAGLTNIEVRVGDLSTLAAGEFDYVIAHGVYSWIPRPQDLLDCVARHLSPLGIAYVSYNALPGSHVRSMAGDVLGRFTATSSDRIGDARRLMDLVAAADLDTPHARMMREAMAEAAAKPDHLLIHDEMAEVNHAVWFDEFVDGARQAGLAYLSEAHLADTTVPDQASNAPDEVARQQVADYLSNRSFRQTLLVQADAAPTDHRANPTALGGLWLAVPATRISDAPGQRLRYSMLNGIELTTDNAELAASLDQLGASWPACVLGADLPADPRALLRLYQGRAIEAWYSPVPAAMPGSHPRVSSFTHQQLAAGPRVTNLRHQPLSIDDELGRAAVLLMDGRTSRSQIAAHLTTRPDSPPDTAARLDALLDQLGRASLMLA